MIVHPMVAEEDTDVDDAQRLSTEAQKELEVHLGRTWKPSDTAHVHNRET